MTLSEREKQFKDQVYRQPYPVDILDEFFEYWTEPNRSESKMRFEMEKTWHLGRRLKRWSSVRFSRPDYTKREIAQTVKPLDKAPENETERLQVFFTAYCLKPTLIAFDLFGQWFNLMKTENWLIELSNDDKALLKLVYGNNGEKLRCAWVQKTMDFYYTKGKSFKPKPNLLKAV